MKISFCDGGLCNRLNVLIFCLILKQKYGHEWEICWPRNNWCGADFQTLFELDINVHDRSILSYKESEKNYLFLMHENLCDFNPKQVVINSNLTSYEQYEVILNKYIDVFYCHNLIPSFVNMNDIQAGMSGLKINGNLRQKASQFCIENCIDESVYGLHIRKTDFGDRVDDKELFKLVSSSNGRFFVCSDDEEVNNTFAQLQNCAVFPKKYFPQKKVGNADWVHWITDNEGRNFPFNIDRSEESVIEGLIDLLILSRTTLVKTSSSTFFHMAEIFKSINYF